MTATNTPSSSHRIWLALIGGCLLGLPTGWLLATLAVLPMFLGLFFFLVLGLFIGAAMFRLGKSAAPVPKSTIITIGSIVTLIIWSFALVVEYRQLSEDAARTVSKSFKNRRFTSEEKIHLQTETGDFVQAYLKDNYPPGQFVGYLCWAATNGTIECPRVLGDDTETYNLNQTGPAWVIRVIVSLFLLGFTLLAQLLGLASTPASYNKSANGPQINMHDKQTH